MLTISASDAARFERYRNVGAADECWPWAGGTAPNGYGRFWIGGTTRGAHVVAYALAHRGAQPENVLHKCDNKPCTNPRHLVAGTPLQNARDAKSRGLVPTSQRLTPVRPPTQGKAYGTAVNTAKLNEEKVRDLRKRYAGGESLEALAAAFGVRPATVHYAVTGRTWAHVGGEA